MPRGVGRFLRLADAARRSGTLSILAFFAIVLGSGALLGTGYWVVGLLLLTGLLFLPPPTKRE